MPDNFLVDDGAAFVDVYQIEKADVWVGGQGGKANKQGQSLANRTRHLKGLIEAHDLAADPHPQYLTQAEADALIEARVGDYSIDTGTANAKVVALNPAISAYVGNFSGAFKNALANLGACTIDFGGGPVPMVADDGAALVADDLPAGAVVSYQYIHTDGKAYVTTLITSQGDARYVRIAGVATAAGDPTGADNSTKPASTGWFRVAMSAIATAAGFSYSFTTNGYIKFPTWFAGFIIQWGQFWGGNGTTNVVTLPIAFPNAIFGLYGSVGALSLSDFTTRSLTLVSLGLSQIQVNATPATTTICFWFSIGR